jgi:hypothetical protein
VSRPDLTGYHLVNRGLRQEFGLLALAGRTVRSDGHRQLIEDQLQLCLSVLQHLHAEQDSWLFPTLRERAPEGLPGLDNLENDHGALTKLTAEARNRDVPVEERVSVIQELHHLLNLDLEREERDIVPLIVAAIPAAEWQRSWRKVMNGIPGDQMPVLMGWLASATPEDDQPQVLHVLPWFSRLLFKHFWLPAYQRRRESLYR